MENSSVFDIWSSLAPIREVRSNFSYTISRLDRSMVSLQIQQTSIKVLIKMLSFLLIVFVLHCFNSNFNQTITWWFIAILRKCFLSLRCRIQKISHRWNGREELCRPAILIAAFSQDFGFMKMFCLSKVFATRTDRPKGSASVSPDDELFWSLSIRIRQASYFFTIQPCGIEGVSTFWIRSKQSMNL